MKAMKPKNFFHWLKIYHLYRTAFPRRERKPFFVIVSMQKKGKTDVWYFEEQRKFVGLATTINSKNLILLDYLAIDKSMRSHGFGGQILHNLQSRYSGKGLLVEIESTRRNTADLSERNRRRSFYLSNGFQSMNVWVSLFKVEMELLGYNCQISYEDYFAFYRDNYSAKIAAKNVSEVSNP